MNGRLIYVAHPYGGLEENKAAIDNIMERLVLSDKINVYLSPLHNFSMVYFETEYAKGLQICLVCSFLRRLDVFNPFMPTYSISYIECQIIATFL